MKIIIAIILIFFYSCSYKPAKSYYKNILKEEVFVDIQIDNQQLENFIFIKDEIILDLKTKFNIKIVDKSKNVKTLSLKFTNIKYTPLQYDKYGYALRYKTNVTLKSKYIINGKQQEIISYGVSQYKLEALEKDLDYQKKESIKKASLEAFRQSLSRLNFIFKRSSNKHD